MASLFVEIEDEFDLAYGLFEFVGDLDVGETSLGELDDLRLDRKRLNSVHNWLWFVLLMGCRFDSACDSGLSIFEVLLNSGAIEERWVDCTRRLRFGIV